MKRLILILPIFLIISGCSLIKEKSITVSDSSQKDNYIQEINEESKNPIMTQIFSVDTDPYVYKGISCDWGYLIESSDLYQGSGFFTVSTEGKSYTLYPGSGFFTVTVPYINSKLYDVRENGQNLTSQYIKDAEEKLKNPSLSNPEKCTNLLLIEALKNQQGKINSYTIEDDKIIVSVTLFPYIDNIENYAGFFETNSRGDYERNILQLDEKSVEKTYILANKPKLQTININNSGYTTFVVYNEHFSIYDDDSIKYLSNFNSWINEFCNGEILHSLYKEELIGTNVENWIDRNENNEYCVKDLLYDKEYPAIVSMGFNDSNELERIDLNWWYLTPAN